MGGAIVATNIWCTAGVRVRDESGAKELWKCGVPAVYREALNILH